MAVASAGSLWTAHRVQGHGFEAEQAIPGFVLKSARGPIQCVWLIEGGIDHIWTQIHNAVHLEWDKANLSVGPLIIPFQANCALIEFQTTASWSTLVSAERSR